MFCYKESMRQLRRLNFKILIFFIKIAINKLSEFRHWQAPYKLVHRHVFKPIIILPILPRNNSNDSSNFQYTKKPASSKSRTDSSSPSSEAAKSSVALRPSSHRACVKFATIGKRSRRFLAQLFSSKRKVQIHSSSEALRSSMEHEATASSTDGPPTRSLGIDCHRRSRQS